MAYQIDRYNNTLLTVVEDGTVDQTTDLKFIGKNYAGYGEIQNENFLYLLENFSGANPPPRAISGQVWFDSANSKLKFYDGSLWRTTGGAEVGPNEPTGLAIGDFWWDSENDQLYVWNGTNFVLIGPQNAGEGVTQMLSIEVLDNTGTTRSIIASSINDEIIIIISTVEFTLDSTNPIEGFDRIKKGVTLKNTENSKNGITNDGSNPNKMFYWGTSSSSLGLVGDNGELLTFDKFVRSTTPDFTQIVNFKSDSGIIIGEGLDLKIYIENDNQGVIENQSGQNSVIKIKNTNANGTQTHSVTFTSEGINPATTGIFNLGNTINKWDNVYANTFIGLATQSETLYVSTTGVYAEGSTSSLANTVAVRDGNSNITANLFQGIATQARYADLAEKYTTDKEHPVGTVLAVCVHEDHELEAATASQLVAGVVSEKPAYLMNAEADGQAVALKGRVPVRISGPVKKGQPVYAWNNGVATTMATSGLVGIALETNENEGEKLVECILKV